jgi:hypothetical protein
VTTTCLGAHTAFNNFRIFCPCLTFFSPELEVPTGSGYVFNDGVQSHYCISGKMYVFLDKTVAICETLKVQMTNGLVGQACPAGENLIHNL